jgi:multidrug efflux system membrane fusion protein
MSSHPSPSLPPTQPAPAAGIPWFRWIVAAVLVLAVVYAVFLRPAARNAAAAGGRGGLTGPMPVTAEPAHTADLEVRLISLGTVTPVSTATVRSRVDGELQKLLFTEGQTVAAGDPLAELDPRPFEVQKLQAEAQLAKDNALLENARVDLKRFQGLLAQDSVAEQQVATQDALVHQYEAALKVDQAQVESAALQLTYAHVTAPIPGRIGLRNVDLGNIVHASDAGGIAVITQLHPITVLFSIPQDSVLKVMKRYTSGVPMQVEAFDRDGRTRLATGKLATVDNQIDPTTGTVKLRAEFDNTDEALFPNQFVNVQLVVDELKGVTVIPTAGVQRGTVGTYVYVVGADNTASVRVVETGASEKGQVVITKGLKPGEVVVVDGVDKLKEGAAVELVSRNTGAPAAAPAAVKGAHRTGKKPADGADAATTPSH